MASGTDAASGTSETASSSTFQRYTYQVCSFNLKSSRKLVKYSGRGGKCMVVWAFRVDTTELHNDLEDLLN